MRRAAILVAILCACTTTTTKPVVDGDRGVRFNERSNVRLLLTSDEHGWLDPYKDKDAGVLRGGVLLLKAHLQREGLGSPHVALLSGGDNWTGPHTSTVLKGAPMVRAMNALGYRATALGNHEFDFGVRELARRSAEARFPILAANLFQEAARGRPRWAKASVVLDIDGRKIGVVGLATLKTPQTTDPRHVVGHRFLAYDESLREAVPAVRAQGAEAVIVVMHEALGPALPLAPLLRELQVSFVALGHAHDRRLFIDDGETPDDKSDDVTFCNPGAYMRSYCVVDLELVDGQAPRVRAALRSVAAPLDAPLPADDELGAILAEAGLEAGKLGNEALTIAPEGLKRSGSLGQVVVDSWLTRFPDVDVAITNKGGLRQDIPEGQVRTRDVFSVLPFDNYLVIVELTGDQLAAALLSEEALFGGVTVRGAQVRTLQGKVIAPDAKVRVVVNDFIYRGGDGFKFREWDREPEETSVGWRDPVIEQLRGKQEVLDRPDGRDKR